MPRPIVVLQSFPEPRPTTNPYLVMLRDALAERPGVRVLTFSWRKAFTTRYDVVHLHWPEILVRGEGRGRTVARQVLLLALVVRWWGGRVAVVRTRHNTGAHEDVTGPARLLLGLVDRLTGAEVALNPATPATPGRRRAVVPHGHYRPWFAPHPSSDAVVGRLAFVGLVRPYKGVEELLETFARVSDPTLTLGVFGRPHSAGLAADIAALAGRDHRVTTRLAHLTDADFVTAVTTAEVVVLPHRGMHNSGSALAALSLDRPVLVPDNAVTRALAAEVGPGWVHTYPGDLSPDDLERALADSRSGRRGPRPDLTGREWPPAAEAHERLYRAARDDVRLRSAGPTS